MERNGWAAIQDKITEITGEQYDDLRAALGAIFDGRTKKEVMELLGVSKLALYEKLRNLNMNRYIKSVPTVEAKYGCNVTLWEATGKKKSPCLFCTGANQCKSLCATSCQHRIEYADGMTGPPVRPGVSSMAQTRMCTWTSANTK